MNEQKITFREMREMVMCCSTAATTNAAHHIEVSADRWPDHVRLWDIEPGFVRTACASAAPTFGRPLEIAATSVTGLRGAQAAARSKRITLDQGRCRPRRAPFPYTDLV
jgi:hypothetical protein